MWGALLIVILLFAAVLVTPWFLLPAVVLIFIFALQEEIW